METDYTYYQLNQGEQTRFYLMIAVGDLAVGIVYYNSLLFTLFLAPLFIVTLKKHYTNYLLQKRQHLFLVQFIDLLHSFNASFGSGRQMKEALEEGLLLQRSSYEKNSPMVLELEYLVKCMKESREGEEKLFYSLAKRSGMKDFQNFAEVCEICKETGGDMEKAVTSTTRIIIDKISLEREMKVLSAQKKLEGQLISLMPLFTVLFLKIASPSYIEPLYTSIAGRLIMTGALVLAGIAYYMTDRITKLEVG